MKSKILYSTVLLGSVISTSHAMTTVWENESSSVDINGRVEVRGNASDANKTMSSSSTYRDVSRMRFGVRGAHAINDMMSAMGYFEWEGTNDHSNGDSDVDLNTRYMYARVSFDDWLHISHGHQNTAVTFLTDWTDIAQYFSGYTNEMNPASMDRTEGLFAVGADWMGFHMEVSGTSSAQFYRNGATRDYDGMTVGMSYSFDDMGWYDNMSFSMGAGYYFADIGGYGIIGDDNDNWGWLITAKYSWNDDLYIAAMFQQGEVTKPDGTGRDNFNAIDAFVSYTFLRDYVAAVSYNYYEADNQKERDIDFVAIELTNYMSKQFSMYLTYKFAMLSDSHVTSTMISGDNKENEFVFGLNYLF